MWTKIKKKKKTFTFEKNTGLNYKDSFCTYVLSEHCYSFLLVLNLFNVNL